MLTFVLCLSSLLLFWSGAPQTEAISAYWTPILNSVCGPNVPLNVTRSMISCDELMDKQLATIFDNCVRTVHRLSKEERLTKPKLCYYLKSGMQLDRCKMLRYRTDGITLPELVDREQEHTWCLMKIAQPLGWEKLCSDAPLDVAANKARQAAIQNCETRFQMVTNPIKDCYQREVASSKSSSIFDWVSGKSKHGVSTREQDQHKPAACISFQYSRKIWKCLARKEGNQNLQRQANLYIGCLRAIRQTVAANLLEPINNQLIS